VVELLILLVKVGVLIGGMLTIVAVMSWVERRGSAMIQDRLGPNRVGPFGLFQPVADGLKFIFKEEIIPSEAHKFYFLLSPLLVFVPALTAFAFIPFGSSLPVLGRDVPLIISDVSVGMLLILGLSGLSVYGLVLAGWASSNKYSFMGGIRSSAQMISYELAMTLSVLTVLMTTGSFRLTEVVSSQQGTLFGFLPNWNVFPQFIGFCVFLVTAFAETNRLPFDLPEAEAELVAGYFTEYSSMKFALFYLGEYAHMITASALIVTLYFGGWQLPYGHPEGMLGGILSLAVFAVKTSFFLWFFVWVRWTLPRFRYDQLMKMGWTLFIPLAFLNFLVVSALLILGVI